MRRCCKRCSRGPTPSVPWRSWCERDWVWPNKGDREFEQIYFLMETKQFSSTYQYGEQLHVVFGQAALLCRLLYEWSLLYLECLFTDLYADVSDGDLCRETNRVFVGTDWKVIFIRIWMILFSWWSWETLWTSNCTWARDSKAVANFGWDRKLGDFERISVYFLSNLFQSCSLSRKNIPNLRIHLLL